VQPEPGSCVLACGTVDSTRSARRQQRRRR